MSYRNVTFRLSDEEIEKVKAVGDGVMVDGLRFCFSLLDKYPALVSENAALQKAVFDLSNQVEILNAERSHPFSSSPAPAPSSDSDEDEPSSGSSGSSSFTTIQPNSSDFSPPELPSHFSVYEKLYPDLSEDLKPVLFSIIDLFKVEDKWVNLIPVTQIDWGDCGPVFDKLLRDGFVELAVVRDENCVVNPLLTLRNKRANKS